MNLYITPIEYTRAPTGQETASLIGNLLRLSNATSAGATSLPVSALTVALAVGDVVTIFDGSNSEVVVVTASAQTGASSVATEATAYAHTAGTVICSDGVLGSLSQSIEVASDTLESICQQSLLQQSYTETYTLRTMDATVTSDNILSIRPKHFPVSAVSSLEVFVQNGTAVSMDATQAVIDARARLVTLPSARTNGIGTALNTSIGQQTPGYVTMGYTAGFAYAQLPMSIKQAAIWLTSDALSDRLNPTGAADLQTGQRHASTYLRGDLSGQSALYKRAVERLMPYTRVK